MELTFNQHTGEDLPDKNDMNDILVTGASGDDVWLRQENTSIDKFGGDLAVDTTYLVLGKVTPKIGNDQVDILRLAVGFFKHTLLNSAEANTP